MQLLFENGHFLLEVPGGTVIDSIGLSASTPAIARPEPARNQTGLAGGESRLP